VGGVSQTKFFAATEDSCGRRIKKIPVEIALIGSEIRIMPEMQIYPFGAPPPLKLESFE
jgi:hypothetical protein